jgi:hypothetical protein
MATPTKEKIHSKGYIIEHDINRITFLDSRHYLDEGGKPQPSVTTILDCYPKSAGYYQWLKTVGEDADNIRDDAGRKGSMVHKLTEYFDFGNEIKLLDDKGEPVCSMSEWAMFEKYVDFRKRFSPEIHYIEIDFCSSKLGFGGTLDRVLTINGKNILMDLKTGNNVYTSHWLQQAAYKKLFEEMLAKKTAMKKVKIDAVGILWLNAKTKTEGKKDAIQGVGWQLLTKEKDEIEQDWEIFQATHKLWLAENKNLVPKNFSYSLTHKI